MCLSIQSRLAERDSQVRSGVPFLSRERIGNLTIQGLIQSNPQGFFEIEAYHHSGGGVPTTK